jgi:hypothetical protein
VLLVPQVAVVAVVDHFNRIVMARVNIAKPRPVAMAVLPVLVAFFYQQQHYLLVQYQ